MEETKPAVNRRGLLRRAGAVAAGMGVAGVVTTTAATPAQAAGVPIDIDADNFGEATTSLTAGTNTTATLKLANAATGAPLELEPVEFVSPSDVPVGTTYADSWGDVHVTGIGGGDVKFDNLLYSPTWASMVFPVSSFRLVDTRGGVYTEEHPTFGWGRTHIEGAIFSGDRLQPKNGDANTPDMVIDLSYFLDWANPVNTALQANITVAAASQGGYLALYSGAYRGTSSINYSQVQYAIANFTQTPIEENLRINVKTQWPVVVIVDVVGYVLSDWMTQFGANAALDASSAAALKTRRGPVPRRK